MHHEFGIRQNETNGNRFAHDSGGYWFIDMKTRKMQYRTFPRIGTPNTLRLILEGMGTDHGRHSFDLRVLFRNLKKEVRNG